MSSEVLIVKKRRFHVLISEQNHNFSEIGISCQIQRWIFIITFQKEDRNDSEKNRRWKKVERI